MIGKTARFGTSFLGAIEYCYYAVKPNRSLDRTQVRGELLYYQHVAPGLMADPSVANVPNGERLHIEAIARQFAEVARRNGRVEKPVWHQVFSFPIDNGAWGNSDAPDTGTPNVATPGVVKPNRSTMVRIAQAFAETFGLTNNPMVVFRHTEKDHDHFHIIASRVDREGRNSAQSAHNYRRIGQFCRELEQQFTLTPTPQMTSLQPANTDDFTQPGNVVIPETAASATHSRSKRKGTGADKRALRQAIDRAVSMSGSMDEFCQRLATDSPYQARLVPYTDRQGQAREGIAYSLGKDNEQGELPGYSLGRDYVFGRIVERVQNAKRTNSLASATESSEEVTRSGTLHTTASAKIVDDLLPTVPFAGTAARHESEIERDIARIRQNLIETAQQPGKGPHEQPTKGVQSKPPTRKTKRRKGL